MHEHCLNILISHISVWQSLFSPRIVRPHSTSAISIVIISSSKMTKCCCDDVDDGEWGGGESGRKFICRILFHLYEMTLMTIFFGLLHIQITPYNLQGMSKESYQLRVKTMPAPLIKTGSVDVFLRFITPTWTFSMNKKKKFYLLLLECCQMKMIQLFSPDFRQEQKLNSVCVNK